MKTTSPKFYTHSKYELGVCRIVANHPQDKVEVRFVGRKRHIIFPKSELVSFTPIEISITSSLPPADKVKEFRQVWREIARHYFAIATTSFLLAGRWFQVASFANNSDAAEFLRYFRYMLGVALNVNGKKMAVPQQQYLN